MRVSASQSPQVSARADQLAAQLAEVILQSGTVTNAASLDITDLPTGYRAFKVVFDNLLPVSNSTSLYLRTSSDNGVSFDASASDYRSTSIGSEGGSLAVQIENELNVAQMQMNHAQAFSNVAGNTAAGTLEIYNARDSGVLTKFICHLIYHASNTCVATMGARRNVAEDNDAIRFLFNTGNVSTMNWTLYGVKASTASI